MEYYLVHFDGRMGFQFASDADQAVARTAQDFGYESVSQCYRELEIDVQSLDCVALEDVKHIIGFGGYVPRSVCEHFGIEYA